MWALTSLLALPNAAQCVPLMSVDRPARVGSVRQIEDPPRLLFPLHHRLLLSQLPLLHYYVPSHVRAVPFWDWICTRILRSISVAMSSDSVRFLASCCKPGVGSSIPEAGRSRSHLCQASRFISLSREPMGCMSRCWIRDRVFDPALACFFFFFVWIHLKQLRYACPTVRTQPKSMRGSRKTNNRIA
jgi:hypothetical protein